MSYKNFNRHEAFTDEIHDVFFSFFKDYRSWAWNEAKEGKEVGSVTNKLYGIFDGFLYDGLVDEVKEIGTPSHLVELLSAVVDYTEAWIEANGEISENEAHCINLGLI